MKTIRTRVEWLHGRIEIGGPVTEAQLLEIRLRAGAGEERVEEGRLILEEPLAQFGEFPLLEPYLREQDIPYDRWSEGYDRLDAALVRWRPGMEEPLAVPATAALDSAMLPFAQLQPWLEEWCDGDISENELVQRINTAVGAGLPALPEYRVRDLAAEAEAQAEAEAAELALAEMRETEAKTEADSELETAA